MPIWPNHLGPTRASVSLALCGLLRNRKNALVQRHIPLEQRKAIPRSEMRAVPPVHLQVELSEPTVEEQPRLGRWQRTGAVNGGVVLREDNSTLQLRGAGIGAIAEIDGRAFAPEICPMLRS